MNAEDELVRRCLAILIARAEKRGIERRKDNPEWCKLVAAFLMNGEVDPLERELGIVRRRF